MKVVTEILQDLEILKRLLKHNANLKIRINDYLTPRPIRYATDLKLGNCVPRLLSLDLSIRLGTETHISGTFYLL